MTDMQAHPFARSARKWRAFAERRRVAIVALYRSGDWKDLYTEEAFMALLREAVTSAETWARIAPTPAEELGTTGDSEGYAAEQPPRAAA
jgi:hypothetical protein